MQHPGRSATQQETKSRDRLAVCDTHCHLDRTLSTRTYNLKSLKDLEEHLSERARTHDANLHFVVSNFCDPETWHDIPRLIDDERIFYTIGVHPKKAQPLSDAQQEELKRLLDNPKCVGLGEVGLDETHHNGPVPDGCRTCREQEENLKLQLRLENWDESAIVLHCRPATPDRQSEVYKRCLNILKDSRVRDTTPIHLHSFTGSSEDAKMWQEAYPAVYFGLSMASLQGNLNTITKLPSHQILLETDSPHLAPPPLRKDLAAGQAEARLNHPWNVVRIAQLVAPARSQRVEELIRKCNRNARWCYHIDLSRDSTL
jgi:TatD DNase family protein